MNLGQVRRRTSITLLGGAAAGPVIGYLGGMSSNDVERSATAPPR
jgi:hypothetical protein